MLTRTLQMERLRMISGLVLKYLNGECFVIRRRYKLALPASSKFTLTKPTVVLRCNIVFPVFNQFVMGLFVFVRLCSFSTLTCASWVRSITSTQLLFLTAKTHNSMRLEQLNQSQCIELTIPKRFWLSEHWRPALQGRRGDVLFQRSQNHSQTRV